MSVKILAALLPWGLSLWLLLAARFGRHLIPAFRRARLAEPGPAADLLSALGTRAGTPVRGLLVFQGGIRRWELKERGRLLGLTARDRWVAIDPELLRPEMCGRLEAVLAHEIAHAKERHPPLFLGFLTAISFGAGALVGGGTHLLLGPLLCVAAAVPLGGLLIRRFEREADLTAAELVGWESYGRALEEEATDAARGDLPSWTRQHFERRREELRRLEEEGAARDRFRTRGRLLRSSIGAALALAILVWGAAAILRR